MQGRRFLVAGFAAVLAVSAGAEDKKMSWDDFYPPPDEKFDWVQMNSGEWLKGEIKVMYNYTLEFDSDELDLLELDLDDVKQIRSCGSQEVLFETRRRKTEVMLGVIEMDGDNIRVINGDDVAVYKRSQLVSIAGGSRNERDNWSGNISVGATFRSGNTETMDVTVQFNIQRRTAVTRLNADYLANYSEVETTDDTGEKSTETTADNHRLNGYFDWFLTGRFYWQVLNAEYYSDQFVNIDDQVSVGTGIGYDIIRSSKTEWSATAGAGYQKTWYDVVPATPPPEASSDSPYGSIATWLDVEISDDLDFLYDYSARFLSNDNGRYTHHMVTTLSYEIIADLDFDISLIWDHISNPAAIEEDDGSFSYPDKDDYQLVVGIGYEF